MSRRQPVEKGLFGNVLRLAVGGVGGQEKGSFWPVVAPAALGYERTASLLAVMRRPGCCDGERLPALRWDDLAIEDDGSSP